MDSPIRDELLAQEAGDVVRLSDIAAEPVEWIWPRRIPRGKLAIDIGDPGIGKSLMMIDTLACITVGGPWPDEGSAPVGNVILMTAEDGLADTVRPRFDLAEGDPARLFVLRGMKDKDGSRMFNLQRDLATLEAYIRKEKAIMVGIDPLSAYLGKTDSYRDAEIRSILGPLAALAERTRVAIKGIMHLTKNQQRQVLYRAQGNIAFVASARAVFGIVEDQEIPGRMLYLPVKMNLAKKPDGLAFRLVEALNGGVKLKWDLHPVHVDLESAFAPPGIEDKGERERAEEFLRELLADGPVSSKVVEAKSQKAEIKRSTLWLAKKRLGIRAHRDGYGSGGEWAWAMPKRPAP